MYKVVIIDDEKKICSLIVELGDWDAYHMQVVDICHDGEEGLESIKQHRPDLVLTDVRMPVYDGLELVKQTVELGISSSFVIISGYKYFEYAYSAFKYGVIDYLLKPIEEDQLNEVLKKVFDILEARRQQVKTEKTLKQLHQDLVLDQRRGAFQAIFEGIEPEQKTLEAVFQKVPSQKNWHVFFLKTDRNLQQTDNQPLADKMIETARRIFQATGDLYIEAVLGGLGGILNYGSSQEDKIRSRFNTLLLDARGVAEMFGNSQVTIGVGTTVFSSSALHLSAKDAVNSEREKASLGANRVIDASQTSFSEQTAADLMTVSRQRAAEALLESMNSSGLMNWFSEIESQLNQGQPVHAKELFAFRNRLLELVRFHAAHHNASDLFQLVWEQTQERTESAGGTEKFLNAVKQPLLTYFERLQEKLNSQEKLPIRLAKAYISEHFREPITLERTAEEVGLSPAYFSTRFKEIEKRTFTDYLTWVRLEAAKELLATTRRTNYEIALEVGYMDDKYFTKVFKKEVGIRPGEYRKLYFRG